MKSLKHSLFLLLLLGATTLPAQTDPQLLTNGRDLSGWRSVGGEAPFRAEGHTIVGTAVAGKYNTFLCTERPYGDFVLEFEFRGDAPLNSGVMFRAQERDGEAGRRVIYGYQMEIDPSPRAYTGGIFDESRRGWLYPLSYHEPARGAYRIGAWNRARIEAVGDELRTYINGQPAANLLDDADASGTICLQVHSVGPDQAGLTVRWRDLKLTEGIPADRANSAAGAPQVNTRPNDLSEAERRHGWRLLFDGRSTDGWRGAKLDDFPERGWEVTDGELRVLAGNGGESTNGGDIVTRQHFGDFELKFEFKFTEGANSGVKYYVDPTLNKGAGSAIGLEYQILDDERHPDANFGVRGNRTLASLYDLIPAEVLDVPGRGKGGWPNVWNRGRIVSRGGHVEHWLNGYKVIEYDRFSQIFNALVNYSKYKDWPNFGREAAGPILLQDHGDAVAFRSLKIREF